jgi:uncharacterized membrane protein YhaH (DUF805 family)
MEIEKNESEYNMIDWFKKVVFKNYANFEGRARRSEYWYFTLISVILVLLYFAIGIIFVGFIEIEALAPILSGLAILTYLGLLIPSLAVAVRRLHDTGKSGWFFLIGFVPFGGIVLIVFYATDGDPGTNKWGANPKEIQNPNVDFFE